MHVRKLFAGVAAAATMLGGLALGATTANAADEPAATAGTALLTVNNAQEGHTYTPYRFATFKVGTPASTLEVSTETAWVDIVKTAADAADNAADGTSPDKPAWFDGNPAAYVATFTPEQLRKFADGLAKADNLPAAVTGGAITATAEQNGQNLGFSNVADEGWYLVTDSYTKAGDTAATAGTPAIVATTVNGLDRTFKVKPDAGTGQGKIETVGVFNAKTENPNTPPTKTVKKDGADVNGQSVNVGDTLTYTITHTIPASAANFDKYTYSITDTADKGLSIGVPTVVVKGAGEGGADLTLVKDTDYTLSQNTNGDGKFVTVVTFKKTANTEADAHEVADFAGKTVEVSYTATVTSDIYENETAQAQNKASANVNGTDTGEGTPTTVKTHDFSFIKKNKDEKALKGAVFNVYRGENVNTGEATALTFKDSVLSTATDADAALTSGDYGWVTVKGLAAGKYTVVETQAPTGYSSQFLAKFTVDVAEDGTVELVTANNHLSLAGANTAEKEPGIKVLNVKSVTELPMTGAAGTVLFSAIAVLLAGAAATVYAKSRNTKRMLNA